MKKTGIYCIRNLQSNNIYIGSSVNIKKRWTTHLCQLRKNSHHSNYLQRSFNKYGESSFLFSVMETCTKENLIEREQHYINLLNPRYNISKIAGNVLGVKRTEETKLKLSLSHKGQKAWNKGIPATEEQKTESSNRRRGKISGAKGKKWSLESKEKLSVSKKGKISHDNRIKVLQFDLQGNFIMEFSSISEAERTTNTKGIYQVLKGKYKQANKFLWKKKE